MRFEEIFRQFIHDELNEESAFDSMFSWPFTRKKKLKKKTKTPKKKRLGFFNNFFKPSFFEDEFFNDEFDEQFKTFFALESPQKEEEESIEQEKKEVKKKEIPKIEKKEDKVSEKQVKNEDEVTKEEIVIEEKPKVKAKVKVDENKIPVEKKEKKEDKGVFYSYSSISERFNDVAVKKEKIVDSRKGSKEIFKRKKGDKMMKVVKSKDIEGKEDIKKFWKNVKDEKEFEEMWKIIEPTKTKMLM